MKRDYELILMLDPQVADDQRDKLATDAKSRLESKGTLNHESTWGLRKMAYEIDKQGEADYRYYRFTGESDLLDDLNHNLRITDGVLRFRIFKIDPESPIIEPPDTELIMRRDEDDDRGRGRGRRDDRGPRRPREDEPAAAPAAEETSPEPAAEPAAAAEEPSPEPAAEPPAAAEETSPEPAAEAPAAPAEPADEPAAAEPAAADPDSDA